MNTQDKFLMIPVLFIPVLGFIGHGDERTSPTVSVQTEIIIRATKQEVWNQLVAFSKIDEPDE